MDVRHIVFIFFFIYLFLSIQKTQGFLDCDTSFFPMLYDDMQKIIPNNVPMKNEFISRNLEIIQKIYNLNFRHKTTRIIDMRTSIIIRKFIRKEITSMKFEALTEGPVVDAFTCDLFLEDHCYTGDVCGVETFHEAEIREMYIVIGILVTVALLGISLLSFTVYYYCAKIKASSERCKQLEKDLERGETKSKENGNNGGKK
ncbi:hypothetical protein XENTR_v10024605 [Xenopus tropicalis]|nr:hypothetical protein XENTR_v10024605 [Xenopus tropicalis]